MDTEKEVLARARRVLGEEREAIRNLELTAVEHLATEKQAVFDELGRFETPPLRTDILQLLEAARHNCLLLAHARDINAAALTTLGAAQSGEPGAHKVGLRRAIRVSITG